MQIDVTYDQSQGSLPAGFVTAVNYVVNYYDTTFTNNVTVNIHLGYGEIAGQSLGSGALGESETFFDSVGYSQAVNALKANQPSATQQAAYATLPGSNPLGGGTLWVSTAEEKALGLIAGNNSAIDGYVGFSSTYPFDYSTSAVSGQYYFDGVVAHEFSEVLGRDSLLGEGLGSTNSYSIMDLFRYAAAGTRQLGTGGPAYFSINNGTTNLDSWNTNPNGDLGDWAASAGADSYLAFSPTGQQDWVTQPDLTLMNVLGWDTAPTGPPPVVTTSNLTEPANKTLAASSLFTVSDPNGYAITEYQFWDSTRTAASGHFYINGVQQAPGTVINVAASQLSQVTFVTGTVSNALQVRAFDGTNWSAGDTASWAPFTVNVVAPPPPVVTTSNLTEPANKTLAASSLFTVSDPNGYAITEYQFWDSTRTAASGHFYINGVQQAPGTVINVAASQLSQMTFVTGSISNALQVRAFDGVSWSAGDSAAWAPFTLSISGQSGTSQPPVVTTSNLTEPANTTLAASSLFTVSDPNGHAITEYQFWDSTRSSASGHFYLNGVQQAPGTVIDIAASQLSHMTFVTGSISNALQVRAFDGVSWSAGDTAAWAPFTINIAGQATAAQPQNDVDGRVALLSQYMASTFTNPGSGDSGTSPVGGFADRGPHPLFASPAASQSRHA